MCRFEVGLGVWPSVVGLILFSPVDVLVVGRPFAASECFGPRLVCVARLGVDRSQVVGVVGAPFAVGDHVVDLGCAWGVADVADPGVGVEDGLVAGFEAASCEGLRSALVAVSPCGWFVLVAWLVVAAAPHGA